MRPALRALLAALAVANLVLALGYAFEQPWALATWPWPGGRLSHVFVGSILAAIGAGAAWIAFSGETGSLPAGLLDLAVTLGGITAYLAVTAVLEPRRDLAALAAAIGTLAALNVVLLARTRRLPPPAGAPLPPLVRWSFLAFTAILLAVGVALVLRTPGVMPWPLDDDLSVVIGWIFGGNAFYFLYAFARPRWDAARAQLWSFLAYDLVLIGPLLAHYPAAPSELRTNVLVYAAVLVYSGGLALYYLVLDPRTRGWAPRAASALDRPPDRGQDLS